MFKYLITFLLFVLMQSYLYSQKRFVLSGKVLDSQTNLPLFGASITVDGFLNGAITDSTGLYQIGLPLGKQSITARMIGYKSQTINLNINQDLVFTFKLSQKVVELMEVEIKSSKEDRNIKDAQMGLIKLEMKNLNKIPVVFGEIDVLKALTLKPGITTVGEGAGGFNVRGGRVDQNLVLLDGMPIYNTSHLLGFLSSINAEALSNVTLYKAAIPAQYGGKLASILDMKTKNSTNQEISGSIGIGVITSKIVLEGPIFNEKWSFLVAGRIAYPNFVISKFPEPINKSKAFFYDLNAKVQYKINKKNTLTFSSYGSYDNFKFADDTLFYNNTKMASLIFNHNINSKFSFSVQGVYSDYNFGINGLRPQYEFGLNSFVNHQEIKSQLLYVPNQKLKLELGFNAIRYIIGQGSLKPKNNQSNIIPLSLPTEFASETAPFLNLDWILNDKISLQVGTRYSSFFNMGPKTVFTYQANTSRTRQSIVDSTKFIAGQKIKNYNGFEPRVSLRVGIEKTTALKLSYSKMRQYLHLISNTTAMAPVDYWKPSDSNIPAQVADQFGIGLFKNIKENTYETSFEAYYKDITNLVEYKNGAQLFFNPFLETELLAATGKAYGIETSIQKNKGILKGSFSYTYSRTFAKVVSNNPTEQINEGNWFPATFDKPHNLAIAIQKFLGNGWTFSSNLIYATGRPGSYPDRTYRLLGKTIIDYSFRNLDRIPDYHRFDIGLLKDTRKKLDQKKYNTYSFSIYNLYGRRNPYSIYFQRFNNSIRSYRLSVFGAAIPSLSINYNF